MIKSEKVGVGQNTVHDVFTYCYSTPDVVLFASLTEEQLKSLTQML